MQPTARRCALLKRSQAFVLMAFGLTSQAYAEAPEPLVLIKRLVDARYFEDPSLTSLQHALDQDLKRTAVIGPGGNPSQLIMDNFKFGRKNADKAYQMIENKILDLNGIKDVQAFLRTRRY